MSFLSIGRRLTPAIVMIAPFSLVACGGAPAGGARAAARTAEQYLGAIGAGAPGRACGFLTDRARRELLDNFSEDGKRAPSCEVALARVHHWLTAGERRGMTEVRVRRADVAGSHARIRDGDVLWPGSAATIGRDDGDDTLLVATPHGWRIDELG